MAQLQRPPADRSGGGARSARRQSTDRERPAGLPRPPSARRLAPDFRPAVAAVVLLGVTAAAWVDVVRAGNSMDGMMGGWEPSDASRFVAAWSVMMAAMMLPSAAPLVLLFRRGTSGTGTTAFLTAGYLAVWAAFGLIAWAADRMVMELPARPLAATVLIAAAAYQLTPLKDVCLRSCRSPVSFLMTRWRPGREGALRIGVEHGAYCLGCCWLLMLVLVAAGGMGLTWVAGLTAVVFAEKVLPAGEWTARGLAIVLGALGVATALVPELALALRI